MNTPRVPNQVNLAGIAKRLGVSISTVSRALRNEPGINPVTRARVFEMAKEIGYLNEANMGAMNRARPFNILTLVPASLAYASLAYADQRYLAGMSSAAVTLNLSILSHHIAPAEADSVLDPARQPVMMRNGQVDGIVLIHRWPDTIARHLGKQYPVVSIVHAYPDLPIDLVTTDDRQGVMALARHLVEKGHQKIGFFGLCPEVSWSRSRFSAYVEALVALGLPFRMDRAVSIGLNQALATEPFGESEWSVRVDHCHREGVTAWIAGSSMTALTLHQHCASRGVRVPEEVSITSFHQQTYPEGAMPRFTGMDVADEELGMAAVRRLVHRIKNPEESRRSILLPLRFAPGETSAEVRD